MVELAFTLTESHSKVRALPLYFYDSNSGTPYESRCHKTAGFFYIIYLILHMVPEMIYSND